MINNKTIIIKSRKSQNKHVKGYQYLKLYTLTRLYHVAQICNVSPVVMNCHKESMFVTLWHSDVINPCASVEVLAATNDIM